MRKLGTFPLIVAALSLLGCSDDPQPDAPLSPAPAPEIYDAVETPATAEDVDAAARLAAALAAQPADVQARFAHRRPAETLGFFGIEPGMTVVEVLPGAGWYSKILLPYLGEDGKLVGADYPVALYSLFGFMTEEQLQAKETWTQTWIETAQGWRGPSDASAGAFVLGSLPEEMAETADAVLMIRALHNLARFEPQGGFLSTALSDVYDVLKPGGIVGVVQHEARPEMPDDWASGAAGYLKKDFVIERFEAAGFELVGDSDINANPLDRPTADDVVWRLPPGLRTSRDDPALRAELEAIGESNRMTLKFRKPAE